MFLSSSEQGWHQGLSCSLKVGILAWLLKLHTVLELLPLGCWCRRANVSRSQEEGLGLHRPSRLRDMRQGFHTEGRTRDPSSPCFLRLRAAAHIAVSVIYLCNTALALHRPEARVICKSLLKLGEIPYLSALALPNSQAVTNKQRPLGWLINYISWCYL